MGRDVCMILLRIRGIPARLQHVAGSPNRFPLAIFAKGDNAVISVLHLLRVESSTLQGRF